MRRCEHVRFGMCLCRGSRVKALNRAQRREVAWLSARVQVGVAGDLARLPLVVFDAQSGRVLAELAVHRVEGGFGLAQGVLR